MVSRWDSSVRRCDRVEGERESARRWKWMGRSLLALGVLFMDCRALSCAKARNDGERALLLESTFLLAAFLSSLRDFDLSKSWQSTFTLESTFSKVDSRGFAFLAFFLESAFSNENSGLA